MESLDHLELDPVEVELECWKSVPPGLEMTSLCTGSQPTLSSDTDTATNTWLNPVGLQEILWLEK